MKQNYLSVWPMLLAALALVGCGNNSGKDSSGEELEEVGPKYSKNGLLVPDESRRSLGVKIVDVTEEKVPATLDLQLRIYQNRKESILASATVTLEDAKALKAGQTVRASSAGEDFTGRITRVIGELQKATGMAEVLVELSKTPGAPDLGSFLSASVDLESEATVIAIPRSALLECSDGHSVYTVSGEHFMRTPVEVGAASGDLVEIKDGLYAGDQVVSHPVMSLWMTELAVVKGGQACCVVPAKGK